MKQLITIILLFCASLTFAQVQPQRPDQNGQFNNVTMDRMTINKGLFRGKAMEIMGTKEHNYLIPSSKAVWDFVNQATTSGLSGTGNTGELAIWRADTLYGDPRIRLNTDTLLLPSIITKNTQGTIEPSILAGLNSASKESLLDPKSPVNFFWARDEGDGDWVTTMQVQEGGIIIQEIDGGFGAAPRLQFYSAKTNGPLVPQIPSAGDDVFYFRGIKHKGLNTSRDIYTHGAGITPFLVEVDTVYANGNLGFRVQMGASDNVGGVFSGNGDIRINRTGDIRLRTYTTARNDATVPTNFLYTNNLGDLRAGPLTDVFLSGSTTIDFGSIPAGGMLESGDITLTGIVANKPIAITGPTTFTAGLGLFAYPTGTNTYRIRIFNNTAAPVDPASQTFYINQIKI